MKVGSVLFAMGLAALWPAWASAQQSLFDQPASNEPAAEAAKAKPKPRPKPRGPVPTRNLQISNAGTTAITALEVSGEGKSAKLANPLPPSGKVVLKLPAFKACTVTITTTFEGTATPDSVEQDLCKEKAIRFTE